MRGLLGKAKELAKVEAELSLPDITICLRNLGPTSFSLPQNAEYCIDFPDNSVRSRQAFHHIEGMFLNGKVALLIYDRDAICHDVVGAAVLSRYGEVGYPVTEDDVAAVRASLHEARSRCIRVGPGFGDFYIGVLPFTQCAAGCTVGSSAVEVRSFYASALLFSAKSAGSEAAAVANDLIARGQAAETTGDGFIFPGGVVYPVGLRRECVALVRALTSLGSTSSWRPDRSRRLEPDERGAYPDVPAGTPVATFGGSGSYPRDGVLANGQLAHAGVFIGYEASADGRISGMYLLDQYSAGNGKAPGVSLYQFQDGGRHYKDGRNYSIVVQ
jgi:hypothetical protein